MTVQNPTKVVLVARRSSRERDSVFQYRIDEMTGLCEAAGGSVVAMVSQERSDIDSATYLGKGKMEEAKEIVDQFEAELVAFDAELSPSQVRHLEVLFEVRVIDRTQLILDIFALRAESKAGRLQVEIAQLQYLLPRLTGRGVSMSRLGGGIGTRGPGETKLETDRRRIRDRMSRLRKSLRTLAETRAIQRSRRQGSIPVVALVGYTNAGKTSLMNRWSKERGGVTTIEGHNRLFDTLDPMARRVKAGTTSEIVLLDTVGFVQNLPHLLVDAFKSTLEEVLMADVIVQVVDATTDVITHLATTRKVLEEIGALDKPVITFFNKMDIAEEKPAPDMAATLSVYGSTKSSDEGLTALFDAVQGLISLDPVELTIDGPADSAEFWQSIAKNARVLHADDIADGRIRVTMQVDRKNVAFMQTVQMNAEASADLQKWE